LDKLLLALLGFDAPVVKTLPPPGRGIIVRGNPEDFEMVDEWLQRILEAPPSSRATLYRPRHSVTLVIDAKKMTFQGQEVTWDTLPGLLEKVEDRRFTVFCIGHVDDDPDTLRAFEAARARASELREEFDFEYLSLVGTQPFGAKGAPTHYIPADAKAQKIARPDQLTATPPGRPRHAVKLVVGAERMTFEGEEVTWGELPGLLKKVPDRSQTVLEVSYVTAFPREDFMREVTKDFAWRSAGRLCEQYGFEYLSFTGSCPLGTKGTPTHYIPDETSSASPGL
jgi:hypothetical protein